MNYTWKVVPKTFTDEVGQERTITGIQAKIISNFYFNKEEFKEHNLYVCFVQDTGIIYGERNVSTSTFVAKMVSGGATEEVSKVTIKTIMKDLCFGTVAQMESKAAILAGLYGYELAVETPTPTPSITPTNTVTPTGTEPTPSITPTNTVTPTPTNEV